MATMEDLVQMRCGHEFSKHHVRQAIEDTFDINSTEQDVRCTFMGCNVKWDLDYLADEGIISDGEFEQYNGIQQKRSLVKLPTTKECPHCFESCSEPEQFKGNSYIVTCPKFLCKKSWCWRCGGKWKKRFNAYNTDCGNYGCGSDTTEDDSTPEYKSNHGSKNKRNSKNNNKLNNNKLFQKGQKIRVKWNNGAYYNAKITQIDSKKIHYTYTQDDIKGVVYCNEFEDKIENFSQYLNRNNGKQNHSRQNNGQKRQNKNMTAGLIGLNNLGNTCFMNAALQCMLKTPSFVEEFFYDKVKVTSGSWYNKSGITNAWIKLVKDIYSMNGDSFCNWGSSTYSPNNIKNELQKLRSCIGTGAQEDASIVIEALLNGLDQELCKNEDDIEFEKPVNDGEILSTNEINDIVFNEIWEPYTKQSKNNNSIVRRTFDGIECEILTCGSCKYQQRIFKPFRQIELPLMNKIITLNIKIYIPQINEHKSITFPLELLYDNTMNGVKPIILSEVKPLLSNKDISFPINKDSTNVKVGYIGTDEHKNQRYNNYNHTNMNEWITYLNDNDDCSKIPNYAHVFAVIYNSKDDQKDDDETFIPKFQLICDKNDKYVLNAMGDMIFTKFWKSNGKVLGKAIVERQINNIYVRNNKINVKDYKLAVFYDNHLVNENTYIPITKNGCLLLVWVHKLHNKSSPILDTNINIMFNENENDDVIIKRAILNSKNSKNSKNYKTRNEWSMRGIIDALSNYCASLRDNVINCEFGNLSSFIPAFNDNSGVKLFENEYEQAKQLQNKLQQLSQRENTANKWLKIRMNEILEQNRKEKINYTQPKVLKHIDQCLASYEINQTSNTHVMDCDVCKNCPEIVSRKIDILKPPKVLLLHINRDENNNKMSALVKYPTNDLRFKGETYDLFGVVDHHGSPQCGHYTSYVKGLKNGKWMEMNDSSVSSVYESSVISSNATSLLYNKRSN